MAALNTVARRDGHKAMEEKLTTAQRFLRQVAAGRRAADSKPGLIEAVYLGRSIANKLYEAASEAGLGANDVLCIFVCALPGTDEVVSHVFTRDGQDSHDLEMLRDVYAVRAEPIGTAFYIIDRESAAVLLHTHARPFERSKRTEKILSDALDRLELQLKKDRVSV